MDDQFLLAPISAVSLWAPSRDEALLRRAVEAVATRTTKKSRCWQTKLHKMVSAPKPRWTKRTRGPLLRHYGNWFKKTRRKSMETPIFHLHQRTPREMVVVVKPDHLAQSRERLLHLLPKSKQNHHPFDKSQVDQ